MTGALSGYTTPRTIFGAVVVILGIGGSLANTTFQANASDKRITVVETEVKDMKGALQGIQVSNARVEEAIKGMRQTAEQSRQDTKEAWQRIERKLDR